MLGGEAGMLGVGGGKERGGRSRVRNKMNQCQSPEHPSSLASGLSLPNPSPPAPHKPSMVLPHSDPTMTSPTPP